MVFFNFKIIRLSIYAIFSAIALSACSDSNNPTENTLPISNAGVDKSTRGGATTSLDGIDSFDNDGSIASQSWNQTAGTQVTLSDPTSLTTSFTSPQSSEILTFELTVTDNTGGTSTDTVDITVKNDIALYIDNNYVDYLDAAFGSEPYNLEQGIPTYGYVVKTFTGNTAADFSGAVTANTQALLIPELETGDLNLAIDDATRTVISDYVSGGGVLVTFGEAISTQIALLNATFGWTLTGGVDNASYSLNTTNALGTSFEGAQAVLTYNDGTALLTLADLPTGANLIYADDVSGDAAVVVIPAGSGYVVYLGYDWYDAAPFGSQDGGWLNILERAISISD